MAEDPADKAEPNNAAQQATTVMGPPPPQAGDYVPAPAERIELPPRDPVAFKPSWIVAACVAAVAADVAFRRPPWNNVAGTLLVLVLVVGLLASGKITTRASRIALGLAAVFGVLLSVRTDPRLVAFNIIAVGALTFVATMRPKDVFNYRPLQSLRDLVESVNEGALLLNEIPKELQARRHVRNLSGAAPSRSAALVRGLCIAGPIVLVLGLLLGSADAVFASFFTSPVSAGSLIGHLTLAILGAGLMAFLIRVAHAGSPGETQISAPELGQIETFVVLGSINVLFAVFAVAQLVATTDAGAATLAEQGLDYKAYARQGFFQLLWVAAITLIVLLTIRASTTAWSGRHRLMLILSGTAVLLTLVIVAVAFSRLQLYIADNGLTPLRFYSSVFSIWIGLAFVLVFLRMAGWRAEQAWLFTGIAVSGLVTLFALNLANPEAIIANNNLDRGEQPILWHMEKLTGDGNAVLAEGVDRLPAELQDEVVDRLCSTHDRNGRESGNRDGVLDWNLGQSNGQQALNRLCS